MEFICAKCEKILEKTPNLLISGCSNCGSKVFETKTTEKKDSSIIKTIPKIIPEKLEEYPSFRYEIVPKLIKERDDVERTRKLSEDHIAAVKLKQKGVYEVNLESLFKGKKSDPIILSGQQGVYRIEILPQKEKEQ